MENNERMGPSPVRGGAAGLSGQRAAVLEHLQRGGRPSTIAELATVLDLHVNTVREHLDALVARGLAVRDKAPARGRGRPAWTYAATDQVEPDSRVRDYAGLATALAGHLERTSNDPAGDALEAGRAWGRELAGGRSTTAPHAGAAASGAGARRQTLALMAELGFDPEADAASTTAALRRCPLLDTARRHPQVVCSVHLGIVRGALDRWGADTEGTDLLPFAEPGACRLHLSRQAAGA